MVEQEYVHRPPTATFFRRLRSKNLWIAGTFVHPSCEHGFKGSPSDLRLPASKSTGGPRRAVGATHTYLDKTPTTASAKRPTGEIFAVRILSIHSIEFRLLKSRYRMNLVLTMSAIPLRRECGGRD